MRASNDVALLCRKQNERSAGSDLSAPEAERKSLTRIAVVDQRPFAREMIAQWIRKHLRGRVVMSFETVDRMLVSDPQLRTVHLVILGGLTLHDGCGSMSSAVASVLDHREDLPIVIIADGDEVRAARAALQTGARAFLPLASDSRVATAVINLVLAGGSYVPVSVVNDFQGSTASQASSPPTDESGIPCITPSFLVSRVRLTRREADVLQLLCQGQPNKLIARQLGMHECTVKTHLSHLIRKFEVKNRTGVVLRAATMSIPEIDTVDQ
jgi:DNA-binding NarL/FixJ family response regulator